MDSMDSVAPRHVLLDVMTKAVEIAQASAMSALKVSLDSVAIQVLISLYTQLYMKNTSAF